jgi:hypothetical protein
VTAQEFRRIALSFPEVVESTHMNHPDFRVRGKVFATLAYPTKDWGMIKLPPRSQEEFVFAEPKGFVPMKGAWGRRGATSVRLKDAKKTSVREALAAAWRHVAPEDVGKELDR